jgi:streptomycin 6-kinase
MRVATDLSVFAPHLDAWRLVPDGAAIATRSSRLLPVRRQDGAAAMLKVAHEAEERLGGRMMGWWNGEGAALVLAEHDEALLLERATGAGSLAAMARSGQDAAAAKIICAVVARLHSPRPEPPLDLHPLDRWFEALWPARHAGGLLAEAGAAAERLLASPRDVVPLHGDIHHDNILDFGPRGWLAIDPKGLIGERAFDFANLFRNPGPDVALAPGRFERQVALVAEAAGLERQRLLDWILALCGLSAAWRIADGETPDLDLAVAALATTERARV